MLNDDHPDPEAFLRAEVERGDAAATDPAARRGARAPRRRSTARGTPEERRRAVTRGTQARPLLDDTGAGEGVAGDARRAPDVDVPEPMPDQRELVRIGVPLVRRIAEERARSSGVDDPRELYAPGTFGLMEAASTFHGPAKAFLYGARTYIDGRIVDALRNEHRTLRAVVENALADADQVSIPEEAEGPGHPVRKDDRRERVRRRGLAIAALVLGDPPRRVDLEGTILARLSVGKGLQSLVAKERRVLDLLYVEDMTHDEAGLELGLSKAAVVRLEAKALGNLKRFLERGAGGRRPLRG